MSAFFQLLLLVLMLNNLLLAGVVRLASLIRQVAVQHTAGQMGDELNAMVDQGCTVLDVIVEHPVYGQLTGPLQLSNRYQVGQFIARCQKEDAAPLSLLTEGIHLHTISCPDQAAYERAQASLRTMGLLLEESDTGS